MIKRIVFENFKGFDKVELELENSVLFIGPNNSGKTTALQAFALWDIGLRTWLARKGNKEQNQQKTGIAINRKDLINIPVPQSKLLWRRLHVRRQRDRSKQITDNIRINILIEGNTNGKDWEAGLEFDYFNEESFYCRPLRKGNGKNPDRYIIKNDIAYPTFAYLPPMSGLAVNEFQKQPGEINYLIGQGQTAQVLRNLCYNLFKKNQRFWEELTNTIQNLFGIKLHEPKCNEFTNELELHYCDPSGIELDISSVGKGVQQVLLLLSYISFNPDNILLLDEPDAHLEVLKQREIYNLLVENSVRNHSQIIVASHSEILLNEAAQDSQVIAFIGTPHVINNQSQVAKSLTTIGWENYYQAERKGWVLYLEGTTDLKILQALAKKLKHKAGEFLKDPFVKYIETNIPTKAREHFFALKEAKDNLKGLAIFDNTDKLLKDNNSLNERMWSQREIENYLTFEETIRDYIKSQYSEELPADQISIINDLSQQEPLEVLDETLQELKQAMKFRGLDPWGKEVKASDEVLDPVFRNFSQKMNIPLILRKSSYFLLVEFIPDNLVDKKEVNDMLDLIYEIASSVE